MQKPPTSPARLAAGAGIILLRSGRRNSERWLDWVAAGSQALAFRETLPFRTPLEPSPLPLGTKKASGTVIDTRISR